jgi:hypothetical protein
MLRRSCFVLPLALLVTSARAQIAVTSLSTTTIPGSGSSQHDTPAVTFQNTTIAVTSFVAGGQTYAANTLANQAFIRRNTGAGNANNSSVWYRDGTGGSQSGTYATNYSSLMLRNDLSGGSDNTFANGTSNQTGNIERLDFVFTGGLVATSSLAFAVFERGAAGAHDFFKIAAIPGWDSVNNVPTSYGLLTGPSTSAAWGATNPGADFAYHLFRYNTGDNLTTSTAHTETGTQGIGGLVFTLAQLGISAGTTIYGYSLFGADVTGSGANLIDFTNTTYFPSNTTSATGTGGIDLATINGLSFTAIAVPEPSTYALAGAGVMITAVLIHRRRRRAASGTS